MKLVLGYRIVTARAMTTAEQRIGDAQGAAIEDTSEIAVDLTTPLQEQANTLVHEVLHYLWRNAALGARAEEEQAVTLLANGLCQAFRDNPSFVPAVVAALSGQSTSLLPKRRR